MSLSCAEKWWLKVPLFLIRIEAKITVRRSGFLIWWKLCLNLELGDFRRVMIKTEFTYQNSAVMKHLQTRIFIHFYGTGEE